MIQLADPGERPGDRRLAADVDDDSGAATGQLGQRGVEPALGAGRDRDVRSGRRRASRGGRSHARAAADDRLMPLWEPRARETVIVRSLVTGPAAIARMDISAAPGRAASEPLTGSTWRERRLNGNADPRPCARSAWNRPPARRLGSPPRSPEICGSRTARTPAMVLYAARRTAVPSPPAARTPARPVRIPPRRHPPMITLIRQQALVSTCALPACSTLPERRARSRVIGSQSVRLSANSPRPVSSSGTWATFEFR